MINQEIKKLIETKEFIDIIDDIYEPFKIAIELFSKLENTPIKKWDIEEIKEFSEILTIKSRCYFDPMAINSSNDLIVRLSLNTSKNLYFKFDSVKIEDRIYYINYRVGYSIFLIDFNKLYNYKNKKIQINLTQNLKLFINVLDDILPSKLLARLNIIRSL